jgi:uncharacterized protein YlxW (UPF0749 family)
MLIDDAGIFYLDGTHIGTIAEVVHNWLPSQKTEIKAEFLTLHINWINYTLKFNQQIKEQYEAECLAYQARADAAEVAKLVEPLQIEIAEKDATIVSLQNQIADLQSQLQEASQQVVSQEEILKRLEALEAKQ